MPPAAPPVRSATAQGLSAVLSWSSLATLTAAAGLVPPFQLSAMAFSIATVVGLAWGRVHATPLAQLALVPWGAWALGIYGLLGFHVCYFLALRHAPALEASLVVYLWPLLIVIFSGLLPASEARGRFGGRPVLGAILGFGGSALILAGGDGAPGGTASWLGFALAAAAAVIWASY